MPCCYAAYVQAVAAWRVLVVDDDDGVRDSLRTLFELNQYEVDEATGEPIAPLTSDRANAMRLTAA